MADETSAKVKPLFLIQPGAMKTRDLLRVEKECGVVIVECRNPESVRLVEPPPDAGMDVQARAALALTRMIVNHPSHASSTMNRADLIKFFVESLMNMSQPLPVKKITR